MAKIKTYPTTAPATGDKILFTDVSDNDNTKNATVSSVLDLVTEAPRARAYVYISTSAEPLDTIISSSAYADLNAAFLSNFLVDFTVEQGGNEMVYTGTETKVLKIDGVIELSGATNNNSVTIAVALNGTVQTASAQTLTSVNGDPMPFVGIGMLSLSTDDTISFKVTCTDATDTVSLESLNVVLSQV